MMRILVATDSTTDRGQIVALLESNPDYLVVAQADNGVEAVDLAIQLKPDLVALDIDLPLLDGVEATREIMMRAPTRIVALSSGEDGPDLGRGAEALRAGAVTVVPKPAGPGPFSDLRREIFLEMVRAATRKDIRPLNNLPDMSQAAAAPWMRPTVAFPAVDFETDGTDGEFSMDNRMLGAPLTIEDRAARIRRLMDLDLDVDDIR